LWFCCADTLVVLVDSTGIYIFFLNGPQKLHCASLSKLQKYPSHPDRPIRLYLKELA